VPLGISPAMSKAYIPPRVSIYSSQPTLVSHQLTESWPEHNLVEGEFCDVSEGAVSVGQLIWVHAHGQEFCSLLVSVDDQKAITIKGSDNIERKLTRFEYKIEGAVINPKEVTGEIPRWAGSTQPI
jgi:hypothetical protein